MLADAHSAVWYTQETAQIARELNTDLERGLACGEAAARLQRLGRNEPGPARRERWWNEAIEALTEPLQLLLLGVAALYALLGELDDALTILLVILAVASIEIINELRAKRAIASLRTLSAPVATVVRAGQPEVVPAATIVPGDLVLLQPGDRVPADLRLGESVALQVDESSLTGESVPVHKQAELTLPPETALADRRNLAFAGTLVTAGKGRGVVVATGAATELGRTARLAEMVRPRRTLLQQQMAHLSRWILWLALGFSLLVPILGVLVARQPVQTMLLTGLTLAFATIPEELPILITVVLGLGAYRLARQHAIVKQLQAAETLGAVSVVGTDKTGTLTENTLRVLAYYAGGRDWPATGSHRTDPVGQLLEIGVLASDAQLTRTDGQVTFVGDPTEVALLRAAHDAGIDVAGIRAATRIVEEHPFDDVRKRMSVLGERAGAGWLFMKGAPESVLATCSQVLMGSEVVHLAAPQQEALQAAVEQMVARGFRVLAFAARQAPLSYGPEPSAAERNLTFVGVAGLEDPPRKEVPAAIATLQEAGVRVLMLTGDHPLTARAIAARVGIDARRVVTGRELDAAGEQWSGLVDTASVFARITPEHKLRIVQALEARGQVVAVTGDGVNDAPALRAGAIGVAMGRTGTSVAREAADLVLADDNFATVTVAVSTGRALYANLRKAIRYYLAAKVALVSASLVAVLAQLPVPFEPVQIIIMELFMDLGASTTFVGEPPEGDLMARPPRDPHEPFMNASMQAGIFAGGLSLAAAVAVAYFWAWGQGLDLLGAQATAFATWMIGHLVLAAHMRSEHQPLLRTAPLANRGFWLWVGGAIIVLIAGTNVPLLQERLHLVPLPGTAWVVALAAGLLAPSWWELWKWWRWTSPKPAGRVG